MAIEYIKKAAKTSSTGENNTRDIVIKMLKEIEARSEGMESHARAGDIRLAKYFPDETFNLGELR